MKRNGEFQKLKDGRLWTAESVNEPQGSCSGSRTDPVHEKGVLPRQEAFLT